MLAERLESMSAKGFLRLLKQDDGDIILAIVDEEGESASVEFCAPGAGGGGSRRTYGALIQLIAAMAADNLDLREDVRKPLGIDVEEQKWLVQWGKNCAQPTPPCAWE